MGKSKISENNVIQKCYLCTYHRKKLTLGLFGAPPVTSLHRFPTNLEIRATWMKICGIPETQKVLSNISLCSRHFAPDDYINMDITSLPTHKTLKIGAVPSLYLLPQDSCSINLDCNEPSVRPLTFVACDERNDDDTIRANEQIEFDAKAPCEIAMSPTDSESNNLLLHNARFGVPRYIGDISLTHFSTPERAKQTLRFIKDKFERKNRQVRLLSQQNRRLKKKVQELAVMNHSGHSKNCDSSDSSDNEGEGSNGDVAAKRSSHSTEFIFIEVD